MIELQLGNKCNNCCVMCTLIMPAPNKDDKPFTSEILDILKDGRNGEEICITGGEPTIRADLFEILDYINRNLPQSRIKLITNARAFFYKEYVKRMKKINNLTIITEIHGNGPLLHDKITQVNGSFEQTIIGINNLLGMNMDVQIRLVIHKLNFKQVPDIVKYIKDNFLSISRLVLFPIDLVGNAFRNREKLIVKYSEIKPFVQEAVDIWQKENISFFHIPYCLLDKKYWKNVEGVTVPERRIFLPEQCKACSNEDSCPKIWKTYATIVGTDELKAINGAV